jgi:hypothetical protein
LMFLLILNIEAWDWVAVYMTYEKIVRTIKSEIYHFGEEFRITEI